MGDDSSKPLQPPTPTGGTEVSTLSAAAYEDLRVLARARLRSSGPLTLLDTAGLVSDTYARLAQQHGLEIGSRASFLAYCSRIMRSIVIDLVREKNAVRHGGSAHKITLNTALGESLAEEEEPLHVDEALTALARVEPRLAQVVEMRYFGGYSEGEIAEALSITARTVQRDWQKARALLHSMLSDTG